MSQVFINPGGSDGEDEGDSGKRSSKHELYQACLTGTAEDILRCLEDDDTDSEYFEDSPTGGKHSFRITIDKFCFNYKAGYKVPEMIQETLKEQTTESKDGKTPLHVVALSGRDNAEEILDALLKKGLDINARTKDGNDTPLHLVIQNPKIGKVFPLALKLMEYNPDLFIRNRRLRTPFDNAIAEKQYDLAEVLDGTKTAEEAKDFYYTRMGAMYAPRLLMAVINSDMEVINEFVQCGADPNFVNEHGAGAIHYAVTHCTLPVMDILQILFDAGVNINLQDYEGDTVLNLVIKSVKLRKQKQMNKIVSQLLVWGAATDIQDLDGNAAVALARKRDYDDIVDLLTGERSVSRPTSVRIPSTREPTPAPSIIYEEVESEEEDDFTRKRKPICSIRETERLQKRTMDSTGDNQVHPHPAQISMPQGEDDDLLTPLHKAVLLEDPDERREQIDELLSEGADINAKTKDTGDTALHLAADINLIDTVQQLLQFNANKNIRNKQDNTPFLVAKNKNHGEVMVLLVNSRARENWNKAKEARACIVL